MSNTLHIYGQWWPHAPSKICGTPEALQALRDAIDHALKTGTAKLETFAVDGEGYEVTVVAEPEAENWQLPYSDPIYHPV